MTPYYCEGTSKRPRLLDVQNQSRSHCTARSLSAILQYVSEHGIPESTSRRTLGRQQEQALNIMTPFGLLIQQPEGFPFAVQHPFAVLHDTLSKNRYLMLICATPHANPPSLYHPNIVAQLIHPTNSKPSRYLTQQLDSCDQLRIAFYADEPTWMIQESMKDTSHLSNQV